MGMAAGQARLLSITSRMSDNELRAQIINNNKMRLATESSQVSEAYVNALNQAQMMFTNYDADNNTSYQQLTFNSLTSYNPYNNQYGLVNASGQILVSETDATNFMNANGDRKKFLACYDLEQTTTYFDNLKNEYSNITYTDESGNVIWSPQNEEIPVMYTDANGLTSYISCGYTAEELEEMFFGGNGHSGYDAALSSAVYNNYLTYAEKFDSKYNDYASSVSTQMTNTLDSIKSANGRDLNQIAGAIGGATDADIATYINDLKDILKQVAAKAGYSSNYSESSYFSNLLGDDGNGGRIAQLASEKFTDTWGGEDGNVTKIDDNTILLDGSIKINRYTDSSTGATLYSVQLVDSTYGTDADGNPVINGYTPSKEEDGSDSLNVSALNGSETTITGANGKVYNLGTSLSALFDAGMRLANGGSEAADKTKCTITSTSTMLLDDRKAEVERIINNLYTDIFGLWPVNDHAYAYENGVETLSHQAFREAAKDLLAALLGEGYEVYTPPLDWVPGACNPNGQVKRPTDDKMIPAEYADQIVIEYNGDKYYISLTDVLAMATNVDILVDYIENGIPYYRKNGAYEDNEKQVAGRLAFPEESMQDLVDVIVLNNVMNTYGEPKIAWVDTKNPDENGEAKYKWYSNLFTRMQNGFTVLQDGLASSNEWIQFALENGIVTMEQVDSEDNWNSMNYTNCSDITEQTNDKAVAIAEAEYNAAMNKIENKDKRYDLELKNIDTEHNSLQTEYDSIKTAIDKNIERTFKIYS